LCSAREPGDGTGCHDPLSEPCPDKDGPGPAEDLGAEIVEGVRRVKEKSGPQLIVWGSSTLTPVLLEPGLADEVMLLVFPVLLGTGKRIFSEGTPPRELALVSTKAVGSGVIISTYKPSGPLRTSSYHGDTAV
jgi:hypothetical protein